MTILILMCISTFPTRADVLWLSGGGAYSSFSEISPKAARELRYGKSWSAELDASRGLPFFAVHYAYRTTHVEDLKLRPVNLSPTELDFKLIAHEAGAKYILPLPFFDFYLGAGFLFGNATLGDKERSALGLFGQGGFHFLFNKVIGIKIEYQNNTVETSRFGNLEDKRLKFSQGLFTVGLVIRLGSNGGLYK